jgi:hypothetical protein
MHEISESSLGHEVFHRPENYDTADDNIVRVSARQVRVKLKEYADKEGRGDTWLIDMPKGAYVPVFTRRVQADSQEAMPARSVDPEPAVRPYDRIRFWQFTTLALGAIAVALGIAFLRSTAGAPPAAVNRRSASLTDLVIRPGHRTLVVLADSALVLLQELTGHMVHADEYETRQYPPTLRGGLANSKLQEFAQSLAITQLTSMADVGFASGLVRMRPDAADRISVLHARNVGPRNLKDDNVVLLGGSRSNPWTELFEDRLNFRFDFSNGRTRASIVNTKPQAGEANRYETEGRTGRALRAFARMALVPNLNQTGGVLLISGTTIEATEAASEFFLEEQATQALTKVLGRNPSEGSGFEILLETSAIGGTARNARIIAHRLLP